MVELVISTSGNGTEDFHFERFASGVITSQAKITRCSAVADSFRNFRFFELKSIATIISSMRTVQNPSASGSDELAFFSQWLNIFFCVAVSST